MSITPLPKPPHRERKPPRPIARRVRPKRVRLTERDNLIHECDKVVSQIVRARGRCQRCGRGGPLDCAHIISRRYMGTRFLPGNCLALCRGCHEWAGSLPSPNMRSLAEYAAPFGIEPLEAHARAFCRPTVDELRTRLADLRTYLAELIPCFPC